MNKGPCSRMGERSIHCITAKVTCKRASAKAISKEQVTLVYVVGVPLGMIVCVCVCVLTR